MKFFTAAAIVGAFSGLVAATPAGFPTAAYVPATRPTATTFSIPSAYATLAPVTCLTNTTAATLVNGFASLLTNYKKSVADALLSSDFTDTSDSINFLGGYPLGSTTFPSKAAFEAGQGSQPAIGFSVLAIDAVGCTTAAFRWSANLGSTNLVKGINVLYASNLNATTAGWQIKTMYSEFNSGVWANDIGGSCTP